MVIEKSLGNYLQNLRKERKMSLKEVADHIGIDISLLSKIEHGERQIQIHMIKGMSDLFDIEFKELQINYINSRIDIEYGKLQFIEEALSFYLKNRNKIISSKKNPAGLQNEK
jgi:transcriptional regulator with XRE-family HTH domain